MLRILAFLCLSMSLYADVEYDIILLAPKGQECIQSTIKNSSGLNEAGYVWCTSPSSCPLVYHESFGFRTVPHEDNEASRIEDVNNEGIAVGIFSVSKQDRIFVYNSQKEEYTDLFSIYNPDKAVKSWSIKNLTISDSNEIIFTQSKDSRIFIYNLNDGTSRILTGVNLYASNDKGQMIGSDVGTEEQNSWFLDGEKFQTLGSLDQFNRWAVVPTVFSESGYVAGNGFDSYYESQIFIWDPSSGLQQLDLEKQNIRIKAINEHGDILGTAKVSSSVAQGFIYSQKYGILDLGTLEKGKNSIPLAINNNEQVVGKSFIGAIQKAFIWDINNGMRDLNTLIPEDSIGWKNLSVAKAINDSGYILGRGRYYGVERHFLLVPKN